MAYQQPCHHFLHLIESSIFQKLTKVAMAIFINNITLDDEPMTQNELSN